jgi:hypothetical protein
LNSESCRACLAVTCSAITSTGRYAISAVADGTARKPRSARSWLSLPIRPELAAAIAAMSVVSTATYLVTDHGKPFASEASFGNWMRKAYDAAGLPDCANHGLRKLAAIRLALAGCTAPELCKVFGWSTLAQAQVYIDQADQMQMAEQAMARLDAIKPGT